MKPLLIASLVLTISMPVHGEVYKCIDAKGNATYQGTSCPAASHSVPIDQRFASVLPMGLPAKEAKALAATRSREARAHALRNRRIEETLKALKAKAQRCKLLKAKYLDMRNRNLRHASGSDADMDLVRRMTDACSS